MQASGSGLQESCLIVFSNLDAHPSQRNHHGLSVGITECCAARNTAWDLHHCSIGRPGGRVGDRLGDGLRGRSGSHPEDELRGGLLSRLQDCLGGRHWGNPLNRLRIGLWGHRQGRLRGRLACRPCGRLLNRLQCRPWNRPDDDLRDDLRGNPWDELRDRNTSHSQRFGSRAGARAVRLALGRTLARSSSDAGSSPFGSSLDGSLAVVLDVSKAGVLICFRFCSPSGCRYGFLTDCGSGRDTGSLTGSGCRCRFGPGASPDGRSVLAGRRDYDEGLDKGTDARGSVRQRYTSDRPGGVLLAAFCGLGADRL